MGPSTDQVGEYGFDDGVLSVGDVGLGSGQVIVGEERVIPPDREQRIGVHAVSSIAAIARPIAGLRVIASENPPPGTN